MVSLVTEPAEITQLSAALMDTARKDWMTLEKLHTEMPLTKDFAQPTPSLRQPCALPSGPPAAEDDDAGTAIEPFGVFDPLALGRPG